MATQAVTPTEGTPAPDSTAKIAELEAQVKSVGESTSTGLSAIREQLSRLEANPKLQPTPVQQPAPEEPDFFTDPKRATMQTVGPAIDFLARQQLQTNAYLCAQSLERDPKLGRVMLKWGDEVKLIMSKESPQMQANPIVWNNAAKTVLADHMDEITKAAQDGKSFFVEPAIGSSGPGQINTQQPPKARVYDEKEKKMMKVFGMSEEDWGKRQDEVLAGVTD